MTEHLGGPETPEQLKRRHERYCHGIKHGTGAVFAILAGNDRIPVGSVGYWLSEHDEKQIWEMGWNVLPEYQGQGIATRAAQMILPHVEREAGPRFLHAFPAVDNHASNAICARLGMKCSGEVEIEYPIGEYMRAMNWWLELTSSDRESRE
jgi:RimJ/RimL family protein N-acetyltransferase